MSSSLRILFSVHGYKPAYQFGGPILSVSALAEALVRKGHKVSVFTTNSNLTEDLDVPTDRPIDVDGVEVWYFRHEEPLKKWLPLVSYLSKSMGYLYAPKMRSALEEMVPTVDVVHTHLPFIYPTYAAGRAAHNCGKPLFYTYNSDRFIFASELKALMTDPTLSKKKEQIQRAAVELFMRK